MKLRQRLDADRPIANGVNFGDECSAVPWLNRDNFPSRIGVCDFPNNAGCIPDLSRNEPNRHRPGLRKGSTDFVGTADQLSHVDDLIAGSAKGVRGAIRRNHRHACDRRRHSTFERSNPSFQIGDLCLQDRHGVILGGDVRPQRNYGNQTNQRTTIRAAFCFISLPP
jgi:hypothetical protein